MDLFLVFLQFFRISWVLWHRVDDKKGDVDKVAHDAGDAERFELDHRVRKVDRGANAAD
jgi:hypothetical protein